MRALRSDTNASTGLQSKDVDATYFSLGNDKAGTTKKYVTSSPIGCIPRVEE
jgi:hypothetical protein